MNISNENALKIVTEMSHITSQQLNLIDEKGIIIASTDPERVGTFHEGASLVIANRLEELVVYDNDSYKGAKKGINFPILLDGEIAGVIGITGTYEDVVHYGQIIKKMTEILLLENYLKKEKTINQRIRERFLDEWIFSAASEYSDDFIERGARIGVDVTLVRRVLILETVPHKAIQDSREMLSLVDGVNRVIKNSLADIAGSVLANNSSYAICLVPACNNKKMLHLAQTLRNAIQARYDVTVHVGVDALGTSVNRAYKNARKALKAGKSKRDSAITFYEDVDVEIFMDEISPHVKKEFIQKIFLGLQQHELAETVGLLKLYFETSGSIGETAARMFIHKNTLQYRLKKLSEQTGKDPRKLKDAALIYLAVQFYENLYG